ncbi:MAG: class I SAM-dependent methyltransferase [Oscillospiraceae bacterium]
MLFQWDERVIRWQVDASEYTGYHKAMAELLKRYIPDGGTLCDMGCGLALSDFYLAPALRSVTCVDVDANALAFVRRRAEERGFRNVSTMESDGLKVRGEWDTVLAQFHGSIETMGVPYLRMARERLIIVTHGNTVGSTGPAAYREKKCCNTGTTKAWLDAHGWTYTQENGCLEFGQPHRSLEDAVAATAAYCPNAPEEELREYVKSTVEPTGDPEFPLYTPKERCFGIFVIPRRGNPV